MIWNLTFETAPVAGTLEGYYRLIMPKTKQEQIIIRVYGLIINDKKEVLLSDEYQMGTDMTKFPGGGLIPGEGPAECIKREAIEEFGQEIEILSHFYTTDFYQKALFFPNHQLVSIYYRIGFKEPVRFEIATKPFAFGNRIEGSQSFRWKKIATLDEHELNFPIDRKVVQMLKEQFA